MLTRSSAGRNGSSSSYGASDAGGVEIGSHRRALHYPHTADEYFGQRHGVDEHSPRCATEQDLGKR